MTTDVMTLRDERKFYWQLPVVFVIESAQGITPLLLEDPPFVDPLQHRWCKQQHCGATFTASGGYVSYGSTTCHNNGYFGRCCKCHQ